MNPFVYGVAVAGRAFINRKKEISDISMDLESCEKIFLISRRRYGKTSLLKEVIKELNEKEIKVAYVDLFKCASLEQFVTALAKSLAVFEATGIEKAIKFMKDWIAGLRPQFSVSRDGELSVQIESMPRKRETYNILEDLLKYAQKHAEKTKKNAVIIFDEFQEIMKFGGEQLEKYMRAIIQHQRDVGYVFCGSKKDVLSEMVMKRSRAFFEMGPVISINKIDKSHWRSYLLNTFKNNGFSCEEGIPEKIIAASENIPYYIQSLAHELWDLKNESKEIKVDDIESALISIIKKRTPTCDTLWDMLPGTQQRLLMGLADGEKEKIFSSEFILRYQMGSRTMVEKSIKLLIKKDIIEKDKNAYLFTDLWFEKWIKYSLLEGRSGI